MNAIANDASYVLSWKCKGLSGKTIKPPTTSDNSPTPVKNYNITDKIKVKFNGSCLKQSNKLTYTHKTILNIYIVYELCASGSNSSNPSLKNCSFSAVNLTKNKDIDKYGYSGYRIGFDRR